jgi:hypothetical protein
MSHVTLWISNLVFLFVLTGCALFEERTGPPIFYGPREQVFYANFEEVWRSVNLVLQPYPLRVSNMDQGMLETDEIRGYRVWGPPHKSDVAASGETYRLTIRVIKGALANRAATKVTIVKDSQLRRDFFSDPKSMPSDGLEEKSLLYRIGREVQIERALTKAQKKQNEQN